jgi:hypothetical protein
MFLAAFFMQPERPSRAPRPQILDLHRHRRCDPGEAVRIPGEVARESGVISPAIPI